MADWDPSLYLQYSAERTRPAAELLARVPLADITSGVDLGCGPGNSTALLKQRWPSAQIAGVDNSPAMLEEARQALPDCHFVEADIRQPAAQPDLRQRLTAMDPGPLPPSATPGFAAPVKRRAGGANA